MLALQALCAYEALGPKFDSHFTNFLSDAEILADVEIDGPLDEETRKFAFTLARGAWLETAAIDGLIERTVTHWRIGRMTPVDRNILRLGVHELRARPDTAAEVVISEAIELARRFGDTDSPAFINGVLDAVYKSIGRGTAADAPPM